MRYLFLGLMIAAAVVFHTSYALALSSRDVASIVDILEELSPARGETVYYDDEAAAEWYEFDQEESELIPAAGFSPERWADGYAKTLKGLIALVPDAEFEAIAAGLADKVAAIPGLDHEQKNEALAAIGDVVRELRALRAEGAAHAGAVRPHADRLRALTDF